MIGKESEWISFRAAAAVLDTTTKHVGVLAGTGLLTIRQLPGGRAFLVRSEVERLARQSVRRGTLAEKGGEPE